MTNYLAQQKWKKANKEKVAEIQRNWCKANPEKASARSKRWREKNRDKVNALKRAWSKTTKAKESFKKSAKRQAELKRPFFNELKNKPCLDCKNSFPPECMDFDHVRGEKVANPGNMFTWSQESILAEIAKCDLVCSNCHRIRTFKRKREKNANLQVSTS